MTDKYRVITGTHVDVCPDMPIPCPNKGCNERLLRKSLTNHQEECPKEIIECPFAFIHCREFFEREMLAAHTCNAIEHHLDLSLTHIISLNSDINVLTSNVVQLNRQIDELKLRPTAVQKLVLKMTGFAAYKNNNRIWYSPGFFSGGYKFCLRVDPSGESSCVSCYICLMPGANDGTLEWPFQGDVTIELLNQVRDKGHRKLTIRYNNLTPVIYSSKVVDKVCGPGYGKYEFISHADLSSFDADENCQYLLEDNLYFRVFVKINSKVKPWLVSSVS
jgi:TNF receptor-associated factor 4